MRFEPWIILALTLALLRTEAAQTATCEAPFEFREGLLWVKASCPQSGQPLNLLLDTGAGVSVLNSRTAERLGLKSGRAARVEGVESKLRGHWLRPISLTAAGLQLPANYLAVDLEQLSRSCQQGVDGLIGADFFRGRTVQIDFDKRVIRILSQADAPGNGEAIPLQLRPCGMRVPLGVNSGQRQWVRLDTGCASALEWVTSKVPAEQCGQRTAVGLTKISIPQTLTSVQIGSHQFQNVPTGLHVKPIFAGEAGLLGNGLLSRFSCITVAAKSGRLILESRPAAQ